MILDEELHAMERRANEGESWIHLDASKLVSEVRDLKHQLADPNYLYVGRIHRQAIISRNAKIDALQARIKELEGKTGGES